MIQLTMFEKEVKDATVALDLVKSMYTLDLIKMGVSKEFRKVYLNEFIRIWLYS